MSEYTPTTAEVLWAWAEWRRPFLERDNWFPTAASLREASNAEFDRWLRLEREQQARFWVRVEKVKGGCWTWRGETAGNGYGRCDIDGRNQPAHRVSYEWLVGPIPEGLEIDHLCSVRNCVNPKHLEPVTHRENTLRGKTITSYASKKTHCPRGHELSGANLVPSALRRGKRDCLTCSRIRAAEYRERKRVERDQL